jgi:hypothetical protein
VSDGYYDPNAGNSLELIVQIKEGGVKKLTAKEIDAARSPKGGFTKETLVGWGIPWPPPKGWRQMLIDGQTVPQPGVDGEPASAVRPSACPEAKLLHDVVMSVINAGHGEILNDVDGLHVYYDNHLPTVADVIGGRPQHAIIEGGITFDDNVYRFSCARLVKGTE